jgi:hypothetical protein
MYHIRDGIKPNCGSRAAYGFFELLVLLKAKKTELTAVGIR